MPPSPRRHRHSVAATPTATPPPPRQEETGAALINRGVFVAPGTQPPPGQRRLYLAIEGQDARAVALAKAEMKRVLNEETLNLAAGGSRSQSAMANYGKYSLV